MQEESKKTDKKTACRKNKINVNCGTASFWGRFIFYAAMLFSVEKMQKSLKNDLLT